MGGKEISKLLPNYTAGGPDEIFCVLGSSGFLEVSANRNPAAKVLGVNRGTEVVLTLA